METLQLVETAWFQVSGSVSGLGLGLGLGLESGLEARLLVRVEGRVRVKVGFRLSSRVDSKSEVGRQRRPQAASTDPESSLIIWSVGPSKLLLFLRQMKLFLIPRLSTMLVSLKQDAVQDNIFIHIVCTASETKQGDGVMITKCKNASHSVQRGRGQTLYKNKHFN